MRGAVRRTNKNCSFYIKIVTAFYHFSASFSFTFKRKRCSNFRTIFIYCNLFCAWIVRCASCIRNNLPIGFNFAAILYAIQCLLRSMYSLSIKCVHGARLQKINSPDIFMKREKTQQIICIFLLTFFHFRLVLCKLGLAISFCIHLFIFS